MKLEDLKKELPYQWRVQSYSPTYASAQCAAYIDSRDVQNRLDEVVGPENWQDKYYAEKGMLFCAIGIKINDEWIWKSDTGSESNVEAEKGHSSDAFKRAAVKWGIGRFLYDLPLKTVSTNEVKTKENRPYVVDNGKRVYDLTAFINSMK